jgi:phosphotransferase system enzyme I (PtsI)
MVTYTGKTVFNGIAIGNIAVYLKKDKQVKRNHIEDVEKEWKRFIEAKDAAIEQLKELYKKAVVEVGNDGAAIFEVHQMMLEDMDYLDSIKNIIDTQFVNSEYAVAITADNFYQIFASMEDAYMKERAADVKDISERVLAILHGETSTNVLTQESAIILADDLAPSETVQLDKSKVLAFVTVHGSTNSHTAILARTMNIPALIKVPIEHYEELNGKLAIVDGFTGTLYIEPDQSTYKLMKEKQDNDRQQKELLKALKDKDNITLDGQRIELFANIGSTKDLAAVLQNDAGGIGLFRSEFLYLEKNHYPTEDEQFKVYKMVAENMAGKKVIIRTLDIGADKQIDYFNLEKEDNPAMGYRAIRICLDRTDIFKTQLRALLRASIYGNLAIMYPMIISLEEVLEIKKIVEEVKKELEEEKLPFKNMEQGIMIETPAAALISDILAKEVDFFSIGTNDLTQYTLAIDRQNTKLDKHYNPHHPAILRLINMIADNAHKAGIWVGICGELAADSSLTETFLKMKIDELSVSPSYIYPLRKKIRETDVSKL